MSDLLKAWRLPLPVFNADDGGAGGDAAAAAAADKKDPTVEAGAAAAAAAAAQDGDKGDAADAGTAGEKDQSAAAAASDADKGEGGDKGDRGAGADTLPDNWREIAANGDADLLKMISRYGSLAAMARALKESKDTIRSGKLKRDMPDPKDEKAIAEWRKAEGIPDDPTGYEFSETVKKRMTDADKPLLSSFTEYAHQRNARPDAVNLAADWYFDTLEAMEAKRIEEDAKATSDAEDALRQEWGKEYRANLTLAGQFVANIPGVGKNWSEARLPDGRRLGDIPEFMTWASDMGRQEFGDPVFATPDSAERHNNRKAEIEKIRDTDFDRYEAEGLDKEYRAILEKEMARGSRAA